MTGGAQPSPPMRFSKIRKMYVLQSPCPPLALTGRGSRQPRRPLSAVERTRAGKGGMSACDPQQTLETLSGVWTKIGSSVDDHEEFAVTCKAIGTF
jgi:hypothetical protein